MVSFKGGARQQSRQALNGCLGIPGSQDISETGTHPGPHADQPRSVLSRQQTCDDMVGNLKRADGQILEPCDVPSAVDENVRIVITRGKPQVRQDRTRGVILVEDGKNLVGKIRLRYMV